MSNIGNREVFSKNLAYYIERCGRTQKEIAEIVGVSTSTFNDWVKGKKYPRIDKIEILADYFRILKSDLIEERSDEYREMQKKNNIQADIVLRMQSDDIFMEAVEALYKLDSDKLSNLLAFLK